MPLSLLASSPSLPHIVWLGLFSYCFWLVFVSLFCFIRPAVFLPLFEQFLFLSSVCCLFLSFKVRSHNCEERLLASSCLSHTGRIVMKSALFQNLWRNSSLIKTWQGQRYFSRRPIYRVIISRLFRLRMWNVSDKICRENQNTHFMFCNFSFENRAFCEITWKKYCRVRRATNDNMTYGHWMLNT